MVHVQIVFIENAGFLENTYLDVYQGHVDTFNHILREHRNGAFHPAIGNRYAQAK
jgi:hypothetical protein